MPGFIGKIIKSVIKDSLREITLEPYSNYSVESKQVSPAGVDCAPLSIDQGFASEIKGSAGKSVQIGVYPEPLAEPGEIRLYSRDESGVQQAEIFIKVDGTITVNSNKAVIVNSVDPIELNGNTDNAVRFSILETAFNDLQTKWNTFANAYVPGGPAALGTPPSASASSEDISDAKVDEVLLP